MSEIRWGMCWTWICKMQKYAEFQLGSLVREKEKKKPSSVLSKNTNYLFAFSPYFTTQNWKITIFSSKPKLASWGIGFFWGSRFHLINSLFKVTPATSANKTRSYFIVVNLNGPCKIISNLLPNFSLYTKIQAFNNFLWIKINLQIENTTTSMFCP